MEHLEEIGGLDQIGHTLDGHHEQEATKRSIAVMSGKGGVGKTTTVLNLGAAMAAQGQQTMILDMDLETSNLPIELGYLSAGSTTIQDILETDMDEDLMQTANRVRNRLGLIPSTTSRSQVTWQAPDLERLVDNLDSWVLIDTPPGIGDEQLKIMRAVDAVVVVMTPSESSFIDGMKVVALAEESDTDVLGVVINRAGESRYDLAVDEMRDSLHDIGVMGVIPEDARVKKSKQEHKPLVDIQPSAPATIAYHELAAAITGTEYTPPNVVKRLLGRVKR